MLDVVILTTGSQEVKYCPFSIFFSIIDQHYYIMHVVPTIFLLFISNLEYGHTSVFQHGLPDINLKFCLSTKK